MFQSIKQCTSNEHVQKTSSGNDNRQCNYCKWYPTLNKRAKCLNCPIEACLSCLEKHLNIEIKQTVEHEKHKKLENISIIDRIKSLESRLLVLETWKDIQEQAKNISQKQKKATGIQIKEHDQLEQYGFIVEDLTHEIKNIASSSTNKETECVVQICNQDKELKSINIKCKLKIGKHIISTVGFLDSGCSSVILDQQLAPIENIKQMPIVIGRQMDGTEFSYNKKLENVKIAFWTNCDNYSEYYNIPTVLVRDMTQTKIPFFIGLSFLFQNNGGVTITRDYIHFFKHSSITPNQPELAKLRHKATIKQDDNCNKTKQGQCLCSTKTITYNRYF